MTYKQLPFEYAPVGDGSGFIIKGPTDNRWLLGAVADEFRAGLAEIEKDEPYCGRQFMLGQYARLAAKFFGRFDGKLTVAQVERRVAVVAAYAKCCSSDETHCAEDDLLEAVLRKIADGEHEGEAADIVRAALKVKDIDYRKFYG